MKLLIDITATAEEILSIEKHYHIILEENTQMIVGTTPTDTIERDICIITEENFSYAKQYLNDQNVFVTQYLAIPMRMLDCVRRKELKKVEENQ